MALAQGEGRQQCRSRTIGAATESSVRLGVTTRLTRFGEEGRGFPAPISRATHVPIPGEMPGCDYPADRNSCSPHTACSVPCTKGGSRGAAWNASPAAWLPARRGGTLLVLPQKVLVWWNPPRLSAGRKGSALAHKAWQGGDAAARGGGGSESQGRAPQRQSGAAVS